MEVARFYDDELLEMYPPILAPPRTLPIELKRYGDEFVERSERMREWERDQLASDGLLAEHELNSTLPLTRFF